MALFEDDIYVDSNFSANTNSANSYFSGGTPLETIINSIASNYSSSGSSNSTYVQSGLNIYTGGTPNLPTVNMSAATLSSLSASTLSGGTIYSGGTNLYNIFATIGGSSDITRVQPGSNIATGGTDNFPSVSVVASPSFNNITFSGSAIGNALSATTISATTYYGSGANLTGVAHAFTGTTTLDFGSAVSGESSYTTVEILNSNITEYSTVQMRVTTSTNHLDVEESIIEGLTFIAKDIVDGVGFTIASYASEGTWGSYNLFYRIIN